MGRIEQTLLEGANRRRPNRPKTFARTPTIPEEVRDVSIYDKGPGHLEGYPDHFFLSVVSAMLPSP
jgi:hypothetical protein